MRRGSIGLGRGEAGRRTGRCRGRNAGRRRSDGRAANAVGTASTNTRVDGKVLPSLGTNGEGLVVVIGPVTRVEQVLVVVARVKVEFGRVRVREGGRERVLLGRVEPLRLVGRVAGSRSIVEMHTGITDGAFTSVQVEAHTTVLRFETPSNTGGGDRDGSDLGRAGGNTALRAHVDGAGKAIARSQRADIDAPAPL